LSDPDSKPKPYRIEVSSDPAKYIKKLDKPTRERIKKQLDELALDPMKNSKHLVNSASRSCRVGDFRILFEIIEAERIILISAIGPRGQIYEKL
jgi:mRNA interferase RelE/StbE